MNTTEQLPPIIAELRNYRIGEWHARRGIEQDWQCIYCGSDYLASYDGYRSAELDHIYPQSMGGEHAYENIAVCCRTCNLLKSDYAPMGTTREERLADSRCYVQQARLQMDAELAEIRALVRVTPNLPV